MKTPKVVTTVAPVGRSHDSRGNKTENADNETQSPADSQFCGYGSSEKGSDGRRDNQVGKTISTPAICTELVTTRPKEA